MLRFDSVWVFPALLNWRDVGWSARHLSYWSYGTHINPQNGWNFVFLLTWALSDSCTDLSSVVKWSNSEIPGLRHVVSLWLCFIIVNLLGTIIKTQHVDWPSRSLKDTVFVIKLGFRIFKNWENTCGQKHSKVDIIVVILHDLIHFLFCLFSPLQTLNFTYTEKISVAHERRPPPPQRTVSGHFYTVAGRFYITWLKTEKID